MTKYALGSGRRLRARNIAFALCYALNGATTLCSIVGFFAAAIPNWIMNRRWAWQQTGWAPKKQIISYARYLGGVLVTAVATGRTNSTAGRCRRRITGCGC